MSISKISINNRVFQVHDQRARQLACHTTENLQYKDELFIVSDKVVGYETFVKVKNVQENAVIDNIYAGESAYVFTANGKLNWITVSPTTFTGEAIDLSTTITNASHVSAGKHVIAAIQDGKLYVKGSPLLSSAATNTSDGTMLGQTLTVSTQQWTQVGEYSDWFYVSAFNGSWCAIRGTNGKGTLYVAGYNQFHILGSAGYDGNGQPQLNKNYSTNAYNTFLLNQLTPITIVQNGERITPNDWIKVSKGKYNTIAQRENGKLYVWGCITNGCLGNGTNYWVDINNSQISKETNGEITNILHAGVSQPQVLKVRQYADDYNEETNPQAYQDVEYSDWIDFSTTWYHAAAVRKNSNGQNQVYFWGANEYGQFGNGTFCQASLYASNLGAASKTIEIKNRPWKLTKDLFPYTDVVKVSATHYGTFLVRENGQVYFAGSNKRNYLGIYSNNSGVATFITKFTKINEIGQLFCETYGSIAKRQIPYLTEQSDDLIKSIFENQLSIDKLFYAIAQTHHHAIDTALIDSTVTNLYNYVQYVPQAVIKKHEHVNFSVLNKLSQSNGILLLDGNPISSSNTSTGATYVQIDPSNQKLDTLADIVGFSNIAGGYPLQVCSYHANEFDNKGYIVVTPTGHQFHNQDRWATVYLSSAQKPQDLELEEGQEYNGYAKKIDCETLRQGCYAICYTSTAKTSIYYETLITSIADLNTFITKVNDNANYVGTLYDLSGINGSNTNWANGNVVVELITKATYPKDQMYIKKDDSSDDYIKMSTFGGSYTGSHNTQSNTWFNIYRADGTLLVNKTVFDSPVYNEDGQQLQFIAQMIVPKSYETVDDEIVPVYHSYYNNNTASGDAIITAETISNGIYRKKATTYNKIGMQDGYEEFSDDLFKVGSDIYIAPSKNDFNGTAPHRYTIEDSYAFSEHGTASHYVIKINQVLVKDEEDSNVTYSPGSTKDPMLAVVKSPFRSFTSQVSGQFNASIGYNSTTFGNNNKTFGDFSITFGVSNTNIGSASVTVGTLNSVTSDHTFVLGVNNDIAGDSAFVYGNSNYISGYDSLVLGSNCKSYGNSVFSIGNSHQLNGLNNIAIGIRNKTYSNAKNSILLGYNLINNAENAIIIGSNIELKNYQGKFPSNQVAQKLTTFDTNTYDESGTHNKHSFHLTVGQKQEQKSILSYYKYRWQANNQYFATSVGSRSSLQPMNLIVDHRWQFKGNVFIYIPQNEDQTEFRNAGKVKTFDSGITITDPLQELDFNKASRFKIKTSVSITPTLLNWNDGATGEIIVYGGTQVNWDSNWKWIGDTPTSMTSESHDKFALIKVTIIDSKIIAQNLGTF